MVTSRVVRLSYFSQRTRLRESSACDSRLFVDFVSGLFVYLVVAGLRDVVGTMTLTIHIRREEGLFALIISLQ